MRKCLTAEGFAQKSLSPSLAQSTTDDLLGEGPRGRGGFMRNPQTQLNNPQRRQARPRKENFTNRSVPILVPGLGLLGGHAQRVAGTEAAPRLQLSARCYFG